MVGGLEPGSLQPITLALNNSLFIKIKYIGNQCLIKKFTCLLLLLTAASIVAFY